MDSQLGIENTIFDPQLVETQGYIGLILLFKNPHVSGPAQFKPLLLKGELYYEHRGTTWYLFKFSGVQGY